MDESLVVTAIEPQKRRKHRRSIYVNGGFWAGVDAYVVAKLGLCAGMKVDRRLLEEVVQEEEVQSARTYAVNYWLKYGERSEAEMRARLEARGYAPEVAAETIRWLRDQGVLDDARVAAALIPALRQGKRAGPRLVAQKLRQKRIPAEICRQALQEAYAGADLAAEAAEAARRRLARMQEPDPVRRRKRLTDFLLRRGFPYGAVRTAVAAVLDDEVGGADGEGPGAGAGEWSATEDPE